MDRARLPPSPQELLILYIQMIMSRHAGVLIAIVVKVVVTTAFSIGVWSVDGHPPPNWGEGQ